MYRMATIKVAHLSTYHTCLEPLKTKWNGFHEDVSRVSENKFWQQQSVKFDFTADLMGTGNRSEEVIKWYRSFMIVGYIITMRT